MSKDREDLRDFTNGELLAKLATQVAALTSAVQNLTQGSQQSGQQSAQQTTMGQILSDLQNQVATSSSRDTDVNAEEAMKSYSPMWGLKGNMLFASEFHNMDVVRNQQTQIIQNAITQSNILGQEAVAAAGRRIGLYDKYALTSANHPTYFAENAPAQKDTSGEGGDV